MTKPGAISRRTFGAVGLAGLALPGWAAPSGGGDPYRPQVHFSPVRGFMNDPNGLVRVGDDYHLFYQLSPDAPVPGHVGWGHAVSGDLLPWRDLPMALRESAAGQVFSGSAVEDRGNRSGLFAGRTGGLVAAYTRASDTRQAQEIAFSADGGRTFRAYSGNPVIDIGLASFRDPKLLWHEPTRRWSELGRFGPAGLPGIDFECPDLVELPVRGGGRRWVLFVSINPGAPLGGSAIQYFIGDFDGRRFVAADAVTRLADFGPDFYAMQTFSGTAEPIGIAWMSNWLYAGETPTGAWRGVMTLPRRLALEQAADGLHLVQTPVSLEGLAGRPLLDGARPAATGSLARADVPIGAALDLDLAIDASPGSLVTIRLANDGGEELAIAFDAGGFATLGLDRGGTRGFTHRFFMEKAIWSAPAGTRTIDLRVIVDRCTLELFALGGRASGTMLHFFAAPPTRLEIVSERAPAALSRLRMSTLRPALARG